MAIIFNDMVGCYDRIKMNLNTITLRRLGMDKQVAISHAKTVTGMSHRIRIAFGNSQNIISPKPQFGGSGQGRGGSPPACHSKLIPLATTLEKITPGHLLQDPTHSIKVLQHVISWVDDTVNKEDLP